MSVTVPTSDTDNSALTNADDIGPSHTQYVTGIPIITDQKVLKPNDWAASFAAAQAAGSVILGTYLSGYWVWSTSLYEKAEYVPPHGGEVWNGAAANGARGAPSLNDTTTRNNFADDLKAEFVARKAFGYNSAFLDNAVYGGDYTWANWCAFLTRIRTHLTANDMPLFVNLNIDMTAAIPGADLTALVNVGCHWTFETGNFSAPENAAWTRLKSNTRAILDAGYAVLWLPENTSEAAGVKWSDFAKQIRIKGDRLFVARPFFRAAPGWTSTYIVGEGSKYGLPAGTQLPQRSGRHNRR